MAIVIFILSFLVRVYHLTLFPLNHDEATWTLGSLGQFDKFIGIPVACFRGYIQPFLSYLVFISKIFFSSPEYIVRIPSVVIGALTVSLVYILAKEMYGKKTGFISSLILCFLPWHIIQSKIGVSVISIPFFGCLIIYILMIALKKKSNILFILSWFLLGLGSFYTYQAGLIYIPIYMFLLFFLKKELRCIRNKAIFLSISIFLVTIFPVIYLQLAGKIDFFSKFYRFFHIDSLHGNIFLNLFLNLKINIALAFKSLFIASDGTILYGAAFRSPLIINKLSIFVFFCSLCIFIYRHSLADKIILVWICIGGFLSFAGINTFAPRYIIVILVPVIISLGYGLSMILDYAKKNKSLYRYGIFFIGIFICVQLIFCELLQLRDYYIRAPVDLEECRRNSYGCKEAADYLSKVKNIKDCIIRQDNRMVISTYLKYTHNITDKVRNYARNSGDDIETYYAIWAPETHPEEYWHGMFSFLYNYFVKKYPHEMPIKTIYYPDGFPAIRIYRVVK